jgi:hypothetical protein
VWRDPQEMQVACMRDFFILNKLKQVKIYFDMQFAWLKYCAYYILPVQALNYKQYILLPSKLQMYVSH